MLCKKSINDNFDLSIDCHPDRSKAEWKDQLIIQPENSACPCKDRRAQEWICHPDRSGFVIPTDMEGLHSFSLKITFTKKSVRFLHSTAFWSLYGQAKLVHDNLIRFLNSAIASFPERKGQAE